MDWVPEAGIQLTWLGLYHYYIEQISELEKGCAKRITAGVLTLALLLSAQPFFSGWGGPWHRMGGWMAITLLFFFYVLFYDAKPLSQQWWRILAPGLMLAVCAMGSGARTLVLCSGGIMAAFLLLLEAERGYLRWGLGILQVAVCGLPAFHLWQLADAAGPGLTAGVFWLQLLLFFSLEGTLFSYHRGFEAQTERFQRDILSHQYEEIREIYLNMRSWRHDYHNHLQVMKAQLAMGQTAEMGRYLDDLEKNLDSVDTYVKSGNLMADAILNSKLSMAKEKNIRVNCKAVLPARISVEDVDLCVLLGNLLDNALEACDELEEQCRFLRIYMAVKGAQLYISIQNSAKEDLDFNERNYITKKRGNHGLGMKRVKALTDKYEGYLTLANEPGIFAAEMTLPLHFT